MQNFWSLNKPLVSIFVKFFFYTGRICAQVYSTPDEDDIQHMYLSEVDMNRVCVASTDSCIAYIDSRTSSVR